MAKKADVSLCFHGAESWRTGAYGDSADQGESPSVKCAGADRSAPWFHNLRGVEQYENTEFSQSVYLKNISYPSVKKISN